MRPLTSVILLATPVASSTFLQWSLCDDSRGSGVIPYGLNARLVEPPEDAATAASRLTVNLVHYQAGSCSDTPGTAADDRDGWPEAMWETEWQGPSKPVSLTGKTKARLDCEDFHPDTRPAWLPVVSSRVSMSLLDEDVGVLPALSTVRFQASINSTVFPEARCIASLMTPAISPSLSSGLHYGPLALFIFVLFVSGLRTMSAASDPEPQLEDEDDSDDSRPAAAPVLLPHVADCLHLLQFIFLSGGLSLAYPGFYPAVAGHLNWFALYANLSLPIRSFVPGPTAEIVRMASPYPGSRDGLYEANGTYGGSLGLEVMTQMVGAPMTCDTWLLMVLFTACIAAVLAVFLWLLETLRPRNVLGLPLLGPGQNNGKWATASRVGKGVLRLLLSYITLPLVAISAYQFNFSGSLGAGHLSLAIAVLLVIALAFTWLAVRLPWASLGGLVFEAKQPYQRIRNHGTEFGDEDSDERKQARRDDRFVMALFILNMIRGLAIGGLQNWGVVQLAMLVVCEVVMLLAIRICRPFPLLSTGFATTMLRLAVLACFVPFSFRPSKLFRLKSIFGYIALSLCAVGLLLIFCVPAAWHLYCLARKGYSQFHHRRVGETSPSVSLRHLRRRKAPSPRHVSGLDSSPSPPRTPLPVGNVWHPRHDVSPPHNQSPPHSQRALRSHDSLTSLFYRPPRSLAAAAPGEASRISPNSSRVASPIDAFSPSPSEWNTPQFGPTAFAPARSSSSTDLQSPTSGISDDFPSSATASVSSDAEASTPLGPKWDDYSFREADLFYAVPPPPQALASRPPLRPLASSSSQAQWGRTSSWNPLKGWKLDGRKPTPSKEKGFSVTRPNRVPHLGPPPSITGTTPPQKEEDDA